MPSCLALLHSAPASPRLAPTSRCSSRSTTSATLCASTPHPSSSTRSSRRGITRATRTTPLTKRILARCSDAGHGLVALRLSHGKVLPNKKQSTTTSVNGVGTMSAFCDATSGTHPVARSSVTLKIGSARQRAGGRHRLLPAVRGSRSSRPDMLHVGHARRDPSYLAVGSS